MSEIPVGSPPAPPGRHAAPSGWYPDPVNPRNERYWDGWQWSRQTRVREQPGQIPPAPYQRQEYQGPGNRPPLAPPAPYGWQPYPYANPRPQVAGGKAAFTADGVPLAGWWWRVLAAILDGIFLAVLVTLSAIPIYRRMIAAIISYVRAASASAQRGEATPPVINPTLLLSPGDQLILLLMSLLIGLAYHIFFLRWKAATPGKMICGLRVVPVDFGRTPQPPALGRATLRTVIWVLPGVYALLIFFRLLDALFPLWHPKRQALHDMAAKTQVIKIR